MQTFYHRHKHLWTQQSKMKSESSRKRDFRIRRKSVGRKVDTFISRHVIYNGQDVTPKPLNPLSYKEGKERAMSVVTIQTGTASDSTRGRSSSFATDSYSSMSKFNTDLHLQTVIGDNFFQQSYLTTTFAEDVVIEPERPLSTVRTSLFVPLSIPSEMPSKISLLLAETHTVFILDIPSTTVEKDTDEGDAAESDNKYYEFITVGKGRNRKIVNAEVQTVPILLKSRETEAQLPKTNHNYAYASGWDMFDTYESTRILDEGADAHAEKKGSKVSMESFRMPSEDKQIMKLVKTNEFLDALCVMERLLANNNYNEQQKRYRGLSEPNPFREGIEYKYNLELLWTFSNDNTKGRCVTAVCWNSSNEDILAVSYGKFYYADTTTGMVMVWNIKNPVQPERTYNFDEPVTSIDFSKQHPNLLAVGFYDGNIKVLDVSVKTMKLLGVTSRQDSPLFEPIWQVEWYTDDDYYKGIEFLMAASQDGRISKFALETGSYMPYSHMMRVARAEGKLKGLQMASKCPVPGIPIARHPAALVFTQHPIDSNVYYVGTGEGVVHKCSKNYYHQHLDLFLAHEGPIYQIKFSPFCNKLFMTCGDDWAVRIWAEGIAEPLMELSKTMQTVQSADWSPSHSTIIANVSANEIFIWDLQRKTYLPQSVTKSPSKCRSTIVQFTRNGRCLLVADIDGNVHLFSLEDMPFPAFFQDDLLTQAIKRELIIKPNLIKKIDKLEGLSFDNMKFKKHFQ